MPLSDRVKSAIARCTDQKSFLRTLLYETLNWPVDRGDSLEELAYSWSADELQATGLEKNVVDARAWQLRRLEANQPWGVFFLEFKNKDAFLTGRGMAGALRKVLRGLVTSRRKDPSQKSWQREHLLFICTYGWTHYKFAYFRPKFGDAQGSRLSTFGWEPDDSSNRTVCEFNLPALVWPEGPAKSDEWLADWARAFDKDRLTNDFFKRFDESLERIQSDLQEFQKFTSAEAYTHAQLLLERLIFLYFLQNRGWLNQEKKYLSLEFEKHKAKPEAYSYYKDFLEKVFWTLSTAPGSSGGRLSGLPFLNGGLFDDDEFFQPSEARETNPPLKVSNRTFQFVFQELLEAFNFTVTEDTPLNQEVAVDPEMLGKVFESIVLHAEQADPDAVAPDKRKATGSYYTPRIVVHFICQEVLYQYLLNRLGRGGWEPRLRTLLAMDTSDGLDEEEKALLRKTITPDQASLILEFVRPLKCCDPSVGSGAFPVGLLHELVNLRRVLETAVKGYVDPTRGEGYGWLQNTKADIVQNCLFGVDIQQQAIEICRLRLWLSLVVDYDLGLDPFESEKGQFNRAIDGISQLPNLEMNFHRGDSLHDHISGVPVLILPEKASRHSEEFKKIARLGDELHRAKRGEKKRRLRVEILRARLDLSERIIKDELKALDTNESGLDTLFHDETSSSSDKRRRIRHEKERLAEALTKIEKDRSELEKLASRQYDNQFYIKLRKLEGADFDSPINFVWNVDFPQIFATRATGKRGGFDIIVGNPPFVTARNPHKRELWRERWPRVCRRTYQLLCPFFDLGFGLLSPGGELGFIVSNAFAKRDFGAPLVETFFPTVELQKVVDCSGLLFPGHGTPTCIVFGANSPPRPTSSIRVAAILPGGGDLRTPPEESPLWATLSSCHDDPGFTNSRVVVADRTRTEMAKWPWRMDATSGPTLAIIERFDEPLSRFAKAFGSMFDTHKDDVFFVSGDTARRNQIQPKHVAPVVIGDLIRNWHLLGFSYVLRPYDEGWKLAVEDKTSGLFRYLRAFKPELGGRATFGGKTYDQAREPWFRYHQMSLDKITAPMSIAYPEISTHFHCKTNPCGTLFTQTAPIILLKASTPDSFSLATALLNSSVALFWLKQVCFNKGAGEDEERDRFEFAAGKIADLPVPNAISKGFDGISDHPATQLRTLSSACSRQAECLPKLALRKVFEKLAEAYQDWNQSLPGYQAPDSICREPFESLEELQRTFQTVQAAREEIRKYMIALQEEMDWLAYVAYGLLPRQHAATQAEQEPRPLEREHRPFTLWGRAQGQYQDALKLIPASWPDNRKRLWAARLEAIRDNEHIRRIEQPVYKRRWDEQWKVGNQWRCGPIAYAAEFTEAFEWWLREKAEWWLENKRSGGPVDVVVWTDALWTDSRIQAAWAVAAEEYAFLETEKAREKAQENDEPAPVPVNPTKDANGFGRKFKTIIDDETVPAGFPFAVPYKDLEKRLKRKVPGKLQSIRGKINVPRERFHRHEDGTYSWAGLQFRS